MTTIAKMLTPAVFALNLALGGSPAAVAAACGFTAPAGWNQADTRWDGDCAAGRAEGLGVLKELQNQKVTRFFFGRLAHGEVELGVIDHADGYVAGRFSQGQPVPSEDPQSFVDGFREAERAATEVAGRFRKAGNEASARFYEAKAKQLREQMD